MNAEVETDIDSAIWSSFNERDKLDILLSVTNEMTEQIHHLESLANKGTFLVCTGLLVGSLVLVEKLKYCPLPVVTPFVWALSF